MIQVAADLRWPAGTGIGVVQRELLSRRPTSVEVMNLNVHGRIGSPLSPIRVATALRQRGHADVYWSPGFIPPLCSRVPAVVTVHDLTHLHYYSWLHKTYYSTILRNLYKRCARIICVSAFTRDEFLQWSRMPPERTVVIHNGVSGKFHAARASTQDKSGAYVLYPGNRRPYKNIRRLIQAYACSSLPRSGISLLLTGAEDSGTRDFARQESVSQYVRFAGTLDDDALVRAYRNALAVAFVSLYEGFGLPLIEAMSSGVPVLCSNRASLPEIACDAALIVDPVSVTDIARGLERVCLDSKVRDGLIAAGFSRAQHFSWDRAAELTWRVVEESAVRKGKE